MWNSTERSVIWVCADYMRGAYRRTRGTTGRTRKRFKARQGGWLDLALDDGLLAAVGGDHLRQQLLAQVHLRLGVVDAVALVAHDLEAEVVEGAAHVVEL